MEGARMVPGDISTLDMLRQLERKVLWLSSYMIHHANHEIDRGDGLKVGGHQASSASLVTLMTALYFHILRPEDRVAVKPHASPVFHAIQYLLGNQTLDKLQNFRGFGGAQSYPSRTKDTCDVDFSTGSVGLGVAVTGFASFVQDYVHAKGWSRDWPKGRMVALMGDAEIDEGNVHEALLEYWKHGLTNCWWVIDYNRQSLDSVVSDRLFMKMAGLFDNLGWKVVLIKYGKLLQRAFAEPGGQRLKQWIDDCPNLLYSALVFQGGAAWRRQLEEDLAIHPDTLDIVRRHDDAGLARLMTNLGGHDLETIVEAFEEAPTGQPVCFIAYTIKGFGLPFQGHKDNHSGLMTKAQLNELRAREGINQGEEWDKLAGLGLPADAVERYPRAGALRAQRPAPAAGAAVPVAPFPKVEAKGTDGDAGGLRPHPRRDRARRRPAGRAHRHHLAGCHRLDQPRRLGEPARAVLDGEPGGRVQGARPDVAAEVGDEPQGTAHRARHRRDEPVPAAVGARPVAFAVRRAAAAGGHALRSVHLPRARCAQLRLLPGLRAFSSSERRRASTLAPEGGAHQSIGTPLIGMAQDGLAAFEPAYVDELAAIMEWAFDYIQREGAEDKEERWHRDEKGGSVYLRLSTRPLEQPSRPMTRRARPLPSSTAATGCASRDPTPRYGACRRLYGRGRARGHRGRRDC